MIGAVRESKLDVVDLMVAELEGSEGNLYFSSSLLAELTDSWDS